jgi:DNA-binding NtrC family response regulator
MNPATPASDNLTKDLHAESAQQFESVPAEPTVLMATIDPTISSSMRDLLAMYPLRTLWARSVAEVRAVLAKENVAACFCGFWLVDGTYRDVVSLLKHRPVEVPAILVCEPTCPNEYRDYLASLNIRAFDFICYPYRKTDVERILRAAFSERARGSRSDDGFEARRTGRDQSAISPSR